jgi:hypothetical protein
VGVQRPIGGATPSAGKLMSELPRGGQPRLRALVAWLEGQDPLHQPRPPPAATLRSTFLRLTWGAPPASHGP